MNWSIRYAASKRVYDELTSVLPEGWQIKETRPAEFGEWYRRNKLIPLPGMPPGNMQDPRNWDKPRITRHLMHPNYVNTEEKISKPEAIDCHNPTTGNTMTILSHGAMHSTGLSPDNPMSKAYIWGRDYFNPIVYGDSITRTLKQVDKLRKGVHVDYTSEPGSVYFGEGSASARSQNGDMPSDLIEHFAPSPMDADKSTRIYKDWHEKYQSDIVIPDDPNDASSEEAGITHEIGHLHHNDDYKNNMRTYFSTLIDHHNRLSDDKVDKKHTLGLFDNHVEGALTGENYEKLGQHISSDGNSPLSPIIKKVLSTTAPLETYTAKINAVTGDTYNYYAKNLNESYAEHYAAFHNPQKTYGNDQITKTIANDAGKKLGW